MPLLTYSGVEDFHLAVSAVNHVLDTVQGERGLRNVRSNHTLGKTEKIFNQHFFNIPVQHLRLIGLRSIGRELDFFYRSTGTTWETIKKSLPVPGTNN